MKKTFDHQRHDGRQTAVDNQELTLTVNNRILTKQNAGEIIRLRLKQLTNGFLEWPGKQHCWDGGSRF